MVGVARGDGAFARADVFLPLADIVSGDARGATAAADERVDAAREQTIAIWFRRRK